MKKEQTLGKKISRIFLIIIGLSFVTYCLYYFIHYYSYDDYKNYLTSYSYEVGQEFVSNEMGEGELSEYSLVEENEMIQMYINEKTTDVAIFDKRNQAIIYSTPQNAGTDEVANQTNLNYLQSQIIVDFYNSSRGTGIYDSYSMSVTREQYSIEKIEGGVRVVYDIGNHSESESMVPLYLTGDKFEEVYEKLSEDEAVAFDRYYSTNSDVKDMRQLIAVASKNRIALEKIEGFLLSADFTGEDYVEQMQLAGVEASIEPSFLIPLEYRLSEDGIKVSIPVSQIKEYGGSSIYRLQLLRNFGAASNEEEGYIVVPNGDGSLIYFNNGKEKEALYSQYVYGIDPLLADYTVLENTNQSTMPIYALCREDSSVLAIIEEGASLALITAGVSGKFNEYNYVYSSFVLRGGDTLAMFGTTGNEAELPIVEPDMYDVNISVEYKFLTDAYEGYAGIANYYREKLVVDGVLSIQDEQSELPFYYDVITGVEQAAFFLGNQYMQLTPMTTFDEVGEIALDLYDRGITNQVVNVQGWFNGGYYHDVVDQVKISWKLGGTKGLEELNEQIREVGGKMYADVIFQKIPYTSKYYSEQNETSKYYGSGYIVSLGQVNPTNLRKTASLGYEETLYYLLSPKYLDRYIEAFIGDTDTLALDGYSLRDLGNELHSDKKRTNVIHREEALEIVRASLGMLEESEKQIMLANPNQYAWSVADDIINLPLNDNDFPIIDEQIPLYEMLVHGSIDYCGQVYNLAAKTSREEFILSSIEYGAAPHFVFTKNGSSEMKYSGMNALYSTTYDVWEEEAIQVYEEISEVLNPVRGTTMTDHEIIDEDIRIVTYSNQNKIYINYSDEEVKIDGIMIPAMGYVLRGQE